MFAGHMNHQVDPCPVDNRFMIAVTLHIRIHAGVVQGRTLSAKLDVVSIPITRC